MFPSPCPPSLGSSPPPVRKGPSAAGPTNPASAEARSQLSKMRSGRAPSTALAKMAEGMRAARGREAAGILADSVGGAGARWRPRGEVRGAAGPVRGASETGDPGVPPARGGAAVAGFSPVDGPPASAAPWGALRAGSPATPGCTGPSLCPQLRSRPAGGADRPRLVPLPCRGQRGPGVPTRGGGPELHAGARRTEPAPARPAGAPAGPGRRVPLRRPEDTEAGRADRRLLLQGARPPRPYPAAASRPSAAAGPGLPLWVLAPHPLLHKFRGVVMPVFS